MSGKHTPGPWSRNIPPARHYPVVFSGRNTHVARLTDDGRVSDDEAEANINLIAAAPDLLEFAEEVRRTGDKRLASMAIAVIAKATQTGGGK